RPPGRRRTAPRPARRVGGRAPAAGASAWPGAGGPPCRAFYSRAVSIPPRAVRRHVGNGNHNPPEGRRPMRKINVLTFMTLDGVMQAPGGPEEDTSRGFTRGGWSVGYFDDALGQEMAKQMGYKFDLLLGRRTYEIFASYWPKVTDASGEP